MKYIDYKEKVDNILENVHEFHERFYDGMIFSGPSLYFHKVALKDVNLKDFDRTLESTYAVLTSWGMHRMGSRGSKMNDFDKFKTSIILLRKDIDQAKKMRLENIESIDFSVIERIFKNINIMKSETILVGNSKVMAHLLPHLIPPVDRNYTLKYIKGSTSIKNGKDEEWQLLKEMLINFFNPIAADADFLKLASSWIKKNEIYSWDTSIPKVIDNLIIGSFEKK
ncbi:MAG: hypothetical protein WCP91_01330 [Candidatus Berkelbacteria bacterium]